MSNSASSACSAFDVLAVLIRRYTRLIAVFVGRALLRSAAELIEGAVGAPRLRIESARAGNRQHVAMAAALGAVFRRTSPSPRLEFRHGGGERGGVDRLDGPE